MSIASSDPVAATDHTLTLSDGRTLAWREYGDPGGTPVMGFHGTPGSRIWFIDDDPIAHELKIRLIAPDRPGYGLSSPRQTPTVRGWADDVAQIADHLKLERFGLIGGSGGGFYVLACAAYLGERVTTAATFGSVAPLGVKLDLGNLAIANRIGFFVSRHVTPRFPWFMRAMVNPLAKENPESIVRQLAVQMCPADQQALADPAYREIAIATIQEAYAQGADGHVADATLVGRPWGFDLGDVLTPVHLWQGEEDTLVPAAMGRYIADALPSCTPHFLPGKGHLLDADENAWRAMLESLTLR